MYLIMPTGLRMATRRMTSCRMPPGSHDRSKARAYHGGDLVGIKNHLPYLKIWE